MAGENLTLALSEIVSKMGETLSVADAGSVEKMTELILSKVPVPLSGKALELSLENRVMKIESVAGSKIPVAAALKLKKQFASEDALIFSHGPDAFGAVMEVISSLPDLPGVAEKTGRQTLSLSKDGNETAPSENNALEDMTNARLAESK